MKQWYRSKTVWVNILALIAALGFDMSGEEMTAVIAVINLILRSVTNEGLTTGGE